MVEHINPMSDTAVNNNNYNNTGSDNNIQEYKKTKSAASLCTLYGHLELSKVKVNCNSFLSNLNRRRLLLTRAIYDYRAERDGRRA